MMFLFCMILIFHRWWCDGISEIDEKR